MLLPVGFYFLLLQATEKPVDSSVLVCFALVVHALTPSNVGQKHHKCPMEMLEPETNLHRRV